jgi:hypothetical protein
MKPLKPFMLRRWRIGSSADGSQTYFYTCARPGRSKDPATKKARVPDDVVHRWVLGLPRPKTAVLSLLGRKPDRTSEFTFYSFYGGFDSSHEHSGAMSFQEWLDHWHGDLSILVLEHPTEDFEQIDPANLDKIASDIRQLSQAGRTVVVVDSGGVTRTGQVCRHMHAAEVTGWVETRK